MCEARRVHAELFTLAKGIVVAGLVGGLLLGCQQRSCGCTCACVEADGGPFQVHTSVSWSGSACASSCREACAGNRQAYAGYDVGSCRWMPWLD